MNSTHPSQPKTRHIILLSLKNDDDWKTASEIARALNIPVGTVSKALNRLVDRCLVARRETIPEGKKRKIVRFKLAL